MWWQYKELIAAKAKEHSLDPVLVAALVHIESTGNADAFRFEPKFWSRYLAKLPEYKGRNPRRYSSSYGLMQIMHRTAYETGFRGEPEELFLPTVNMEWACQRLRMLIDWAEKYKEVAPAKRLAAAIASYNGGRGGNKPTEEPLRNGHYVRKVNDAYRKIEPQFPKDVVLGHRDDEPLL